LAFAGKMFAKGSVTEFGGEILDDQSRHVVVVSCVGVLWWEGVVVMSREKCRGKSSGRFIHLLLSQNFKVYKV
jgi:hypothetical protein